MIRPVCPADFQELLQLEEQAFPKSQYDLREFWSLYRRYPGTFFVDDNRRIDGYIVFSEDGHIISMAVAAPHRRHGIGTRLVQEVLAQCVETPLRLEVRVSNLGAQKFYQKLGFIIRGSVQRYYLDGEEALLMERPVGGNEGISEEQG